MFRIVIWRSKNWSLGTFPSRIIHSNFTLSCINSWRFSIKWDLLFWRFLSLLIFLILKSRRGKFMIFMNIIRMFRAFAHNIYYRLEEFFGNSSEFLITLIDQIFCFGAVISRFFFTTWMYVTFHQFEIWIVFYTL